MSTFAFPQDSDSDELGANMDTFVGKDIAVQALSLDTVPISTREYGTSYALRVRIIDLDSGDLSGPHLLFWSKVQEQVVRTQQGGADWTVGRIENVPQQADPTRSVYLIRANADLDFELVGNTITAAEKTVVHTTEGPF